MHAIMAFHYREDKSCWAVSACKAFCLRSGLHYEASYKNLRPYSLNNFFLEGPQITPATGNDKQ